MSLPKHIRQCKIIMFKWNFKETELAESHTVYCKICFGIVAREHGKLIQTLFIH